MWYTSLFVLSRKINSLTSASRHTTSFYSECAPYTLKCYLYPLFDNPIIQKQRNSVTIAAKVHPITNRFPVKWDVDTIKDSCIGCSDSPSLMPATSLISAPPEQTEKHWNMFYDTAADQIDFPRITQGSNTETENKRQMKSTPTLTQADLKTRLSLRQEAKMQ